MNTMKDRDEPDQLNDEAEPTRPSGRQGVEEMADLSVLQRSLVVRRMEMGISQAELARRVGTSRSALARIEKGTTDCRISTLQRIALALGGKVDLSYKRVSLRKQQLAELCRRRHINKLSLFGSVLRSDFSPDSDIDILVEFEPGHVPGLAFFEIEQELSDIFRRKVDLNTPQFLSRYFRDDVLEEAEVQYDAA